MLNWFRKDPLLVKKLLPTGMTQFDEWSDRIIKQTNIVATYDSQQFALAAMITTLGKTDSAIEDLYFIKALHKGAADQIAGAKMEEIRNRVKTRLASEQAKQSEVTPIKEGAANEVLEHPSV